MLGVDAGIGIGIGAFIAAIIVVPIVRAINGLPVVRDVVEGIEPAAMGLAGEDHAFELGVGKHAVRSYAFGQHRAVIRNWMGDCRHGGGLHQRSRMRPGAFDAHGAGRPRLIGAGVGLGRIARDYFRVGMSGDDLV